jgi:hypothetical protein
VLVPPVDEQLLAQAIINLLRDPQRCAAMRECGKRKAAQYDWSIIARRVLDYYDQLIAAHAHAAKAKSLAGKRRFARVRKILGWRGRKSSTKGAV